ncbi:MAG: hypothetical protein ACREQW_25205 [Candidatus Binatia bacterium]
MNAKLGAGSTGKRMYLTRSWMSPGPQVDESDGFRIDSLIKGKTQDRFETKYFRDPVIRLMLAVLEDAVNCYVKYHDAKSRRGQRIFREAKEWFFSDDTNWLFSYENICDLVGINPSYLRNGMLRGNYGQNVGEVVGSVTAGREDLPSEPAPRESRGSLIRRTPPLREGLRARKQMKIVQSGSSGVPA